MAIPLLDLKLQYATIRDEALRVTAEVYESQYFILGKRVDDFERDFAAYCQTQTRHRRLVRAPTRCSIALMVLGRRPGDEVIVPAYSFFATAGVVARLGATPVFVDIDLADYNIDPAQIEAQITPRTKAIMPVHLYGQCAPMDEINGHRRRSTASPVDRGRGAGGRLRSTTAGAPARSARWAAFSFFPSKNLGAFGDAGAVTTNDDDARGEARSTSASTACGRSTTTTTSAATSASTRCRRPSCTSSCRTSRRGTKGGAATPRSTRGSSPMRSLGERVVLPRELPGRRHIYNQYIIRFPEGRATRDRVMNHLKSAGIGCEVYYPLTLPQQECFTRRPGAPATLSEFRHRRAPDAGHPDFSGADEEQMAEVVREIAVEGVAGWREQRHICLRGRSSVA